MSFIKKDVNFGLLFIVILLAVAIASIGIYYNQKYGSLSENYHTQLDNLEQVTEDLLFHKSRLNQTASDLKVKEQDESDLNRRYTEMRDEKEKVDKRNTELDAGLREKSDQLVTATNDLLAAKSEIADQKTEIADLDRKIEVYKAKIHNLEDNFDTVCGGDISIC